MRHPIYVLHVKQGYEDRAISIERQLAALELEFHWVEEYDIADLNDELLAQYKPNPILRPSEISCALKHICAWQQIAKSESGGGFVFEDDVIFDLPRFNDIVNKGLQEFNSQGNTRGAIYLGNADGLRVPWTKLRRGQHIYPANHVRAADSYWVSSEVARARLSWIEQHGISISADLLINKVDHELGIRFFWLEPTVVSQGTHTGHFASSIQNNKAGNWKQRLKWYIKVFRRRWLYPLVGIDLTRQC